MNPESQEKMNAQIDSELKSYVQMAASELASQQRMDMDQYDLKAVGIASRLRETFPGEEEAVIALARKGAMDSKADNDFYQMRMYERIINMLQEGKAGESEAA